MVVDCLLSTICLSEKIDTGASDFWIWTGSSGIGNSTHIFFFALFSCDVSDLIVNDKETDDGNDLGESNDDDSGLGETNDAYSFIDQDLQGEHTNSQWDFISGYAEEDYFDETMWSFTLYNIPPAEDAPPSFGYIGTVEPRLMFSTMKQVDLNELHYDLYSSDNFTVTFYNPETAMNTVATQGAVEILSIDNTENTITGRMDVWYGDKSEYHVNGNFTVPLI